MSHHGYPPIDRQHCGSCRYSVELPKRTHDDALRCARHAPVIQPDFVAAGDGTAWGLWPATLPELWCGEWAPRDPEVR